MRLMKLMIKQFLNEPFWFKMLISAALLLSILLSSSFFSDNIYLQSFSKLAAAIFFTAYGIKMRRSYLHSAIFFTLAVICIVLSVQAIL
ncbi:hypothetical protein CVD28_05830 [Bacillus sp. M6-12]|uniref:hypothetical protein n=1 Tax=Bacillus sp. M6-12 TaxID=2054166 RepID=UPI000C76ABAA|nr:hypothetical protein [Bacillus sp. M6-12]PLS18653.1 hypothetical protein CVD28_05830 [Bacillus sp. M6-12]